MKILFVIAALRNGGAERVLNVLTNELCKDNEITIALLEEDLGLYKFDEKIKIINLNVTGSGVALKFKKILALRALFKEQKADLIMSFIDWTNVACVLANFGLKSKLIATEHHEHSYLKSKIASTMRDLAYRFVYGLSVLSKSDYDYYKFAKNREIIHNLLFIDVPEIYEKQNVILSVARLEAVKGYDVYFEALSKVDKSLLDGWEIKIAGSGRQEAELKQMASNLGLNVKFLGHMSDVGKLYSEAKIFTLCSRSEGLSNVLIESGAFGCARISSDTVGAMELINDGLDGLIFKNGDANDLKDKLEMLLKDENLRAKLAKNASKNANLFSKENIIKQWREFIKKVVGK